MHPVIFVSLLVTICIIGTALFAIVMCKASRTGDDMFARAMHDKYGEPIE